MGAGTIVKDDNNVKNLTTAASIWATAAVGMAVGVGAWFLALVATLIVWVILAVMQGIDIKTKKSKSERKAEASEKV